MCTKWFLAKTEKNEKKKKTKKKNRILFWIPSDKKQRYVSLPVKNIGIEMKNPPTAQTRLTLDFCRYLLPLSEKERKWNSNYIFTLAIHSKWKFRIPNRNRNHLFEVFNCSLGLPFNCSSNVTGYVCVLCIVSIFSPLSTIQSSMIIDHHNNNNVDKCERMHKTRTIVLVELMWFFLN